MNLVKISIRWFSRTDEKVTGVFQCEPLSPKNNQTEPTRLKVVEFVHLEYSRDSGVTTDFISPSIRYTGLPEQLKTEVDTILGSEVTVQPNEMAKEFPVTNIANPLTGG